MPSERELVTAIESHLTRLGQASASMLFWNERVEETAKEERDLSLAEANALLDQKIQQVTTEHDKVLAAIEAEFQKTSAQTRADFESLTSYFTRQHDLRIEDNEAQYQRALAEARDLFARTTAEAEQEHQRQRTASQTLYRQTQSQVQQGYAASIAQITGTIQTVNQTEGLSAAPFDDEVWRRFAPSTGNHHPPAITRLGLLSEPGLWEPLTLPAALPVIGGHGVLLKARGAVKPAAVQAMQSLLLRILATLPPGKLRFTFVDPIGLGQNAAAFMHLADHDEQLVDGKAWSEPTHIEAQLAALAEHMENVIQKYLRNQFATIEEYNAQAGEVAESYRVLLVFDFPANFTEASARRLVSIAQNGPRCGVYAVVLVDTSKPLPYGFNLADLERAATVIAWDGAAWRWRDPDFQECTLILDEPPPAALLDRIIQAAGEGAKQASIVQVPFERVAPPRERWWNAGATTTESLRVKLGPSGATKIQELELGGKGTAHHALVVGKTGSGKSTLMHTIITNLALTYSPDEVQLYLVDFKKGVEFQDYARCLLPHARVVAIESEREFGLSVLQGLKAEGDRRGKLFTAAGVNTLADYRAKTQEKLPRVLLLVDEFQVFFSEDDAIASQATQLLDELVRQGRSFGIHVLLASQTLAGSYSLPRTTVDQMGVRIALQCSDADSRLILSDDNPAARLLERPGQAIYNHANGRPEGNNPFQVAYLEDARRAALLAELRTFATARLGRYTPPIIFEGNAPAQIEKNAALTGLLAGQPLAANAPLAWLGDPIAIRDPLAAAFRKQAGANLLIVGQNEEAAFGLFSAALAALAAQMPADDLPAITLLDFSQADEANADFYTRLAARLPRPITLGKRRQLPALLDELAAEVKRRMDDEATPGRPRFLLIHGLQRARDLRQEEGLGSFAAFDEQPAAASPAQQFATLLREGPDVGIHTLVWCDTVTNLNRTLERRALREFGLRVAFQMSAEDSATLLDTPAAGKLGPYRALFYSEDEGRLEKFRPYGLPSELWLAMPAASKT